MTELGTLAPTSHNDANQNGDNENTNGDWSHHRDPEGSVNVAADRNEESRRERSDSNMDAEEDTAIPGTAADASGPGSVRLEQLLFFLAGLGTSIGYLSTLSSLVYFKLLFGPNSFVYLNCAVFLPLLPVSLAQAIWDSWFDVVYRTRVTFLVRGIVGYGFVLAGTLGILTFGRQAKDDDTAYYYYDYDNDNNNDNDSGEIDDEHHYGLRWVIFHALLQGIGGAVLYGQLNQLASFVGRSHLSHDNDNDTDNDTGDRLAKTFQATLSAGVQASALVVLAASVSSGFGTTNGSRFASFASWILAVELICFVASLWLLAARPRIQVSMLQRDESMSVLQVQLPAAVPGADRDEEEEEEEKQEDDADDRWSSSSSSSCTELEDFHQLLGPPGSSANRTGLLLRQPLLPRRPPLRLAPQNRLRTTSSGDHSQSAELSLTELLYHSRWCCYGMVLTLVPSFLVGSWFTRVQTDWMDLAQVLFYTRIGSDLVGRFATMLVAPSSIRCVVWAAGLRWVLVVLFFVNASHKPSTNPNSAHAVTIQSAWAATTATATTQTTQEQRDALSIALVATIAFCSGYLVTACYQLAPQQLPGTPELRATNAAKQASLLTVAFSVSAIGGLVSSFVLLAIGVGNTTVAGTYIAPA